MMMIGTVSSRTTSVTISGLSPGTTSYFAVVATNGISQAASNWAAVTTPSFSAAACRPTVRAIRHTISGQELAALGPRAAPGSIE